MQAHTQHIIKPYEDSEPMRLKVDIAPKNYISQDAAVWLTLYQRMIKKTKVGL